MEIIIGLIVGIACGIFILGDAKKRGMSAGWSVLGFLFGLIGLIIYIVARKPISESSNINNNNDFDHNQSIDQQVDIPLICPNCKNLNPKKIRLCEWCGGQML